MPQNTPHTASTSGSRFGGLKDASRKARRRARRESAARAPRAAARGGGSAASLMTPPARRRTRQAALGDEGPHAAREAAQAHLALAEGTAAVAARGHAGLHPLDEGLVFQAHTAVDAPV